MASIPRLTEGSSAEQVECCDELITEILSRVSTRDVLKMTTVLQRWRTLIFDSSFPHTHYKNCHRESMFFFEDFKSGNRTMQATFQFRLSNTQTGNICNVPFSWEGIDTSYQNTHLELVTASNGLVCFCSNEFIELLPVFWVYNPVTKFLKKISLPFKVFVDTAIFIGICYTQNTVKVVMAGFALDEEQKYTLVFDSQSNSWHMGPPLLRSVNLPNSYRAKHHPFLNGVIYFIITVDNIDAQDLQEPIDVEELFRDDDDFLYMIMGYDVNQDQWSFSIFLPSSVGFPYCLTEWEGNLFVCASNSTRDENQFALATSSTHDSNRRIRYSKGEGDGYFEFWKVDTEHKLWTQERELDLSHEIHTSWNVSAINGVVWFHCGYNSVTVYHMKNGHCSTHRLDDALALRQPKNLSGLCFEATLLSF
ncbi:hypothetical protein SUGI_0070350 [Cryptomeria japonica]|nr:hypothetical protein SUGI_0070350 [Cryptomeria japonica]